MPPLIVVPVGAWIWGVSWSWSIRACVPTNVLQAKRCACMICHTTGISTDPCPWRLHHRKISAWLNFGIQLAYPYVSRDGHCVRADVHVSWEEEKDARKSAFFWTGGKLWPSWLPLSDVVTFPQKWDANDRFAPATLQQTRVLWWWK